MKKIIAFIGITILFSGTALVNKNEKKYQEPFNNDSIKVDIIEQKMAKLDSLLLELQKYENKKYK